MTKTFESNSPNETKNIAREIARAALPSSVYCLTGGLGAGKTIFAKGFAEGLGLTDDVTSPTFAIVNEYKNENKALERLDLYHFDVYRITDPQEMQDTGFEEYFYGGGVCLVEWAEMIREIIPPDAAWIVIEQDITKGESYRKIIITENVITEKL